MLPLCLELFVPMSVRLLYPLDFAERNRGRGMFLRLLGIVGGGFVGRIFRGQNGFEWVLWMLTLGSQSYDGG